MGLAQGSGSSTWTLVPVGKLRQKPGPVDEAVQQMKRKGKAWAIRRVQPIGGGVSGQEDPGPSFVEVRKVLGAPDPVLGSVSGESRQGLGDTPRGINRSNFKEGSV